jgi:hypothetical protein
MELCAKVARVLPPDDVCSFVTDSDSIEKEFVDVLVAPVDFQGVSLAQECTAG